MPCPKLKLVSAVDMYKTNTADIPYEYALEKAAFLIDLFKVKSETLIWTDKVIWGGYGRMCMNALDGTMHEVNAEDEAYGVVI